MKNKLSLIKKTCIILIIGVSGVFTGLFFLFYPFPDQTSQAQGADPEKIVIYPYNTAEGPNYRYWLQESWCGEVGISQVCYNQFPGQTNEVYYKQGTGGEGDGVLTYAQTGMAWYTDNAPSCCYDTALEPGHNWLDIDDETRNHPIISTTWVQQRIKIPAGITKITDVKFYKIYIYQPGEAVGIKLKIIRASDGVEVYESSEGFLTESWGGYNYIDWGNPNHIAEPGESWRYDFSETTEGGVPVEAGEYYNIRLETTNGTNIGLPVTASCGNACQWWIDRGGSVVWIQEPNEDRPHSETDLYPDGYAESGSSYFDPLSQVNGTKKADIARMAVWGISEPRNDASCESISVPEGFVYTGDSFLASVAMKNEGTTTWTSAGNYKLGSQDPENNNVWGFNRVTSANAVTYPVSPGQTVTYTLNARAPLDQTGNLLFNWKMVQEGVNWFGQTCSSLIEVVNPPTASITGPTTGTAGTSLTYSVTANAGAGSPLNTLTRAMVFVAKQDQSTPTTWGCANNTYAPWCLVTDNTTNPTSFESNWTPSQTGTYYMTINAYNYDGGMCSGNPFGLTGLFRYCDRTNTPHVNDYKTVTVTMVMPTVGDLKIDKTGDAAQGSAYGRSGLRAEQGGENVYNPFFIRQGVVNGNSNNITLVGTAFVSTTAPPPAGNNSLYELTKSAYLGNGFVLLYAQNAKTNVSYYNGSGSSSQSFTKGYFYAYNMGNWFAKSVGTPYTSSQFSVSMSETPTYPNGPVFTLWLYKDIGASKWKTYGYLMDSGNTEASVEKQACNEANTVCK